MHKQAVFTIRNTIGNYCDISTGNWITQIDQEGDQPHPNIMLLLPQDCLMMKQLEHNHNNKRETSLT